MTDDLSGSVVGFARTLRAAGVPASPDRVHAYLAALEALGATRRSQVYWAGRLTLCAGPDDLDRYDRVFAAYFAGEPVRARPTPRRRVRLGSHAVGDEVGASDPDDDETPERSAVTRAASRQELLRHRDVAELTDRERAELHRLLTAMALPGETRRTRRTVPGGRGRIDRRATVRTLLATGEVAALRRRAPREVPRRVVLLVDVSGSMAGYADTLLRFAHVAVRRHGPRTEVFTIGTRLTRVTSAMGHRDPDLALRAVAAAVPDWSGGTRLGDGLQRFLDVWGQRGLARGAIVVILSDGWETGDPSHLGVQTARLSRLARRVVWANPRAGRAGFEPTAAGMAAALPSCDALVEGHSLAALEHLGAVVAGVAVGGADPRAADAVSRDVLPRAGAAAVTGRSRGRTVAVGGDGDA